MEARPTVSMMTKMSDSPIKGRRKRRSTTNPRTKLPARVMRKARITGTLIHDTSTRKKNAPMAMQLAVGEVKHGRRLEDHDKAERRQAIEKSDAQAVDKEL